MPQPTQAKSEVRWHHLESSEVVRLLAVDLKPGLAAAE